MTPPDVWTSEPPSEDGPLWMGVKKGDAIASRRVENCRAVDMRKIWNCYAVRSILPIPSAERAAALEECAAALGCILARINDRGAQLEGYAALARLEACR